MTKKILSALLLVLLAACTLSTPQNTVPDVKTGTEGLVAEFVKNAPPALVFEQTAFPALIKVKNLGTYSLTEPKAILTLSAERDYTSSMRLEVASGFGIQAGPNQQENMQSEALFSLGGKTILNTKGEEEIISYMLVSSKIEPQSETHKSQLFATLCYPYKTELGASACVDTDPNGLRPIKKSCTIQTLQFSQGQGAPVAITSIEPQMLPSTDNQNIIPQFLITIENKGRGEVTRLGSYADLCRNAYKISYQDFNTINMKAFLSNEEMTCSLNAQSTKNEADIKEKIVRLKAKKDTVRCVAKPVPLSRENYAASLRIELEYGYTQTISTEYTIKKPVS